MRRALVSACLAATTVGVLVAVAPLVPAPAGAASVVPVAARHAHHHGVAPHLSSVRPAPAPRAQAVGPWTPVTTVNPDPDADSLNAVGCGSPGSCDAVGSAGSGTAGRTLAEHWNGGSWSLVPSANATLSFSNQLSAVSCTASKDCVAAGSYGATTSVTQTLVESWDGQPGGWTVVPSADTSPSTSNSLDGISCVAGSPRFCMAVGSSGDGALAELSTGGSFTVVPIPGGSTGFLSAVSCTSATACIAVGATGTGTLAERWNGATWAVLATPGASSPALPALEAVSCTSAAFCMATGTEGLTADSSRSVAAVWNGATWSSLAVPHLGTFGNDAYIVSCVSPTSCIGGGYVDHDANDDTYAPLALGWNGSAWSITPVPTVGPQPPQTQFNDMDQIGRSAVGVGYQGGSTAPLLTLGMTAPIGPDGYRLAAADGGIFSFGLPYEGSMAGHPLVAPVVGLAPTPDDQGYFEVGADGGIFTFGDATYHGSMAGVHLDAPIVGMAVTSGGGYYEVAADGGIFAFGGAPFAGSMAGHALNSPVVGMATAPGGGYYEVAADGGIFAFGGAPFAGSMAGTPLVAPVVGLATSGGGYDEAAADGGIFTFGGAPYMGSGSGLGIDAPVVDLAA